MKTITFQVPFEVYLRLKRHPKGKRFLSRTARSMILELLEGRQYREAEIAKDNKVLISKLNKSDSLTPEVAVKLANTDRLGGFDVEIRDVFVLENGLVELGLVVRQGNAPEGYTLLDTIKADSMRAVHLREALDIDVDESLADGLRRRVGAGVRIERWPVSLKSGKSMPVTRYYSLAEATDSTAA